MSTIHERMAIARANGFLAGTTETCCGPGSTLEYTTELRKLLPQLLRKHKIHTLNDAGAGDLNWISQTDLPCVYRAFDLFPHEGVTVLDITCHTMPKADCILCRDVLIHLPQDLIQSALAHFWECAPLLLATGYDKPQHERFDHKYEYFSVKVDLSLPPFGLGEPIEKLSDGEGRWLGLWRLG